MYSCIENVVSDYFFNSLKSYQKWESRNQAVLPIFEEYALVLLLFAWGILALVNYSCCTRQLHWVWYNCLAENIHSITCFRISHPKSPPLFSENKLVFRFASQQKHVLLCWEKDSSTWLFLSEETLKFLLTGFYFKTNRSITNHGTYQWWQLLQAANRACMHTIMISRCQGDEILVAF